MKNIMKKRTLFILLLIIPTTSFAEYTFKYPIDGLNIQKDSATVPPIDIPPVESPLSCTTKPITPLLKANEPRYTLQPNRISAIFSFDSATGTFKDGDDLSAQYINMVNYKINGIQSSYPSVANTDYGTAIGPGSNLLIEIQSVVYDLTTGQACNTGPYITVVNTNYTNLYNQLSH